MSLLPGDSIPIPQPSAHKGKSRKARAVTRRPRPHRPAGRMTTQQRTSERTSGKRTTPKGETGERRERATSANAKGRGGRQGGGKLIRSEAARPVDFSGGGGGEVAGVREFIFAVSVAEEREE